ncbi:hypothetical protein BDR03DRAFT_963964 [Suillus americanus]|nr:hypothetical protein BDR03DRAFT_963964 [Suillus americanus]
MRLTMKMKRSIFLNFTQAVAVQFRPRPSQATDAVSSSTLEIRLRPGPSIMISWRGLSPCHLFSRVVRQITLV